MRRSMVFGFASDDGTRQVGDVNLKGAMLRPAPLKEWAKHAVGQGAPGEIRVSDRP